MVVHELRARRIPSHGICDIRRHQRVVGSALGLAARFLAARPLLLVITLIYVFFVRDNPSDVGLPEVEDGPRESGRWRGRICSAQHHRRVSIGGA